MSLENSRLASVVDSLV